MELRQLHYFLAVADELHFGRAAARLHISQPPLTVHIRRLETELEVPLFDRSTRRVALTAEGAAFREQVQRLLSGLDEAVTEVRDIRTGHRGRARAGFVSSASYRLIPAAVRRVREAEPGITLDLMPLPSGEQIEELVEGRLDLGLLRDPQAQPGLMVEELLTEPLAAVLPSGHPLAERTVVRPADLAAEPLVLFPYRSMPGYVSTVQSLLQTATAAPQVVQRAVNQENILGLVAAGVGVSVLPGSISAAHGPNIATRPLDTGLRTQVAAVYPTSAMNTAAARFLDELRAAAREQNAPEDVTEERAEDAT
ncbi:LysR family transcriptional regulator [Nesterenkonia halophila]